MKSYVESLGSIVYHCKNCKYPKSNEYWVMRNGKIILKTIDQTIAWKEIKENGGVIRASDCTVGVST